MPAGSQLSTLESEVPLRDVVTHTPSSAAWKLVLVCCVAAVAACSSAPGPGSSTTAGSPATGSIEPAASVSPRPDTPAGAQELEIVETGFSVQGDLVNYAVIARNPNADFFVAHSTQLSIRFYQGDTLLGETRNKLGILFPSQVGAAAGYDEIAGTPDHMAISVDAVDWEGTSGAHWLEITDVLTAPHAAGGWATTGTVQAGPDRHWEHVRIVAVYRDASASMLGGDSTVVSVVEPGARVPFTIRTTATMPGVKPEATEIYWGEITTTN